MKNSGNKTIEQNSIYDLIDKNNTVINDIKRFKSSVWFINKDLIETFDLFPDDSLYLLISFLTLNLLARVVVSIKNGFF